MNKMICVIGAGYWGKNHIKTLHKINALGAIVDTNQDSIKDIKDKYPNVPTHTDINEALLCNYDGYVIATPASTHFKIAKIIIGANKPVLIEKPMTLSVEEAKELVLLAKKNDVNVLVGHVLLFHPAIIKIKELVDDGKIGKLQYIYSNRLNLGKVRTQENVFWSLAPHDIAIFQYLTESTPTKINARGSTFLQKGVPDSTLTQLEYENGTKGHIFVSWLHPFKEHRIIVIGSEAMISFDDSLNNKPLKLYSKKINIDFGIPKKIDGPEMIIPFQKKMPLEAELDYFIGHLSNKKPKISNVYQGLEVIKVLVKASKQLSE